MKPRDVVIPDQVIDRTKGVRAFTFFEGGVVCHLGGGGGFDDVLGREVRRAVVWEGGLRSDAAEKGDMDVKNTSGKDVKDSKDSKDEKAALPPNVTVHDKGTLICIEGPQFSTQAESRLYRSWGGSVINMSTLPEAKLAREAEIAYVLICMVTDYDSWSDDHGDVSVETVMGHLKANGVTAAAVLQRILDHVIGKEVLEAKHLYGLVKSGICTAPEGRSEEAMKKLSFMFPTM
ncbi:purine and uridine phosphorylase [Piedraia hortae CBS 480.64]|uniref:Purine and uridine phosphorylase n=1 Tax=Piedraia hortae CBS 480.64 TaxID=1314780 RepID=A0A6A7BZS4_9PEZI|nr:purine and uridine phosphorylase [Piedraia hortae CBS 480.64]